MSETTEIEKKSLEAHVELCAERYSSLDQRLDTLGEKISKVEQAIDTIKDMLSAHVQKNNDRLIGWGVGTIGVLIGTVAWLTATYVFK